MTKVLSQTGLTELIQLSKNEFLPKSGAVEATTVTLSTVATSGNYNDLSNKPTIPTVNNATLTITQGGTTKGTFTANASSNVTIDLDAGGGGSSYTAGTGIDITNNVISAKIATSVSSTSTNTDAVGAKLFYDTVGDVVTLINEL